jgi:membrane protein insertase Oxa1/YidC/SpoIIIJ
LLALLGAHHILHVSRIRVNNFLGGWRNLSSGGRNMVFPFFLRQTSERGKMSWLILTLYKTIVTIITTKLNMKKLKFCSHNVCVSSVSSDCFPKQC